MSAKGTKSGKVAVRGLSPRLYFPLDEDFAAKFDFIFAKTLSLANISLLSLKYSSLSVYLKASGGFKCISTACFLPVSPINLSKYRLATSLVPKLKPGECMFLWKPNMRLAERYSACGYLQSTFSSSGKATSMARPRERLRVDFIFTYVAGLCWKEAASSVL